MTDLAKLVGEDAEHLWKWLDYYDVYYKNGDPYGVIGVKIDDGISFVYSMAINNMKYTKTMLSVMKKINDTVPCGFVFTRDSNTCLDIISIFKKIGNHIHETETHFIAFNLKERR